MSGITSYSQTSGNFSQTGIGTFATGSGAIKDLVHPSLNEALKTQNSVTFKLVKTGESIICVQFMTAYNEFLRFMKTA